MSVSAVIKTEGKASLKDKWIGAVAVSLPSVAVFILIIALFSLRQTLAQSGEILISRIVLGLSVLIGIICLCLILGSTRWFSLVSKGEDASVSCIFYYFSSFRLFFKALWFSLNFLFRALVIGIICFIPFVLICFLQSQGFYDITGLVAPDITPVLWPLSYLFFLACFALFVFVFSRYSISPALFTLCDTAGVQQSFKASKKLMEGNSKLWFGFFISMAGWFVLGFLGVPLLYTIPCFSISYAVFSLKILEEHRSEAAFWGQKPII